MFFQRYKNKDNLCSVSLLHFLYLKGDDKTIEKYERKKIETVHFPYCLSECCSDPCSIFVIPSVMYSGM
jgi:hypothetical protein